MDSPRPASADRAGLTRVAIMGGADGLGLVLGIIAGMLVSHQPPRAVWAAAVSGGVAELLSMANAQRLSDAQSGWLAAIVIGLASFAACTVPAVPYSFSRGPAALTASLVLCAVTAGVISWLRPEKGILAAAETFGLLLATGIACGLIGLWL